MKKMNFTLKKAALILNAGLMLVSFIACPSPTDPKDEPQSEPEPIVDTFVSEHVTATAVTGGVEFTIEKKAEDEEILQIFINEKDEIALQINDGISEKITELNKKGKIKFIFPFTEAEKESTFHIWFNCGKWENSTTTHEADITVKATNGLGKATDFYEKEDFDKIELSISDKNKSKNLLLNLPAGNNTFDSFIIDDTVLTADSLNLYINRVKDNISDFITNGVVDLNSIQGKKILAELESNNGSDIYSLFGLTKSGLNEKMNGYSKYSTTLNLKFKIASDIVASCNLSGIEFFTPELISKSFAYKATYTDPTKDASKHISIASDKKGIKVTANWLEEDGRWYDTALIEKESGMGIYFSESLGTIPTKENPTVTYYYIFTEKDKAYTFSFASNTEKGGYHEEILECKAGGGDTTLFDISGIANAKAEVKADGSYKIDDVSTIFNFLNSNKYKDVFVKLTFNSGDIYWFDTQFAGTETDYIIKNGVIDKADYVELLNFKKIDETSETYTNLNIRDKWFMEANLLVQLLDNDTLYTIKNLKADSDFTQS